MGVFVMQLQPDWVGWTILMMFLLVLLSIPMTAGIQTPVLRLQAKQPWDTFSGPELAMLMYTEKLTLRPAQMVKADIDALKAEGIDDGEILEANQIIGYFNYVNRCLNGLGVTTDGDTVGYYAKED